MSNSPPTTHRISEFHQWDKGNNLELRPPFQRKPVWTEKHWSYLIDTILKGFPVPEIYVQVKTDEVGNTKYIVVDGQQRINTILRFIDGEFFLLSSESPEYADKEFSDLSDGEKRDFWNYELVTRELKTNSEEEVKHIFRRLNKYTIPLNDQELRNATYNGKFIKIMEELGEDDFWTDNKIVTLADVRRMRNIEYASELFIAMMDGIQHGRKNLDKYYQMYDVEFADGNDWKKHFIKTQSMIIDIIGELKGAHWNSKSDFYGLFVCFSELLKKYYFPQEKYDTLKTTLLEFRKKVNIEKDKSKVKDIVIYYDSINVSISKKEQRQKRVNIIKKLVLPFLIPKDSTREFIDEQRQLAWDLSKDKKCAICDKEVTWKDYDLDHKESHSKGGKTTLENSQITHKSCNRSKSNK